MRTNLLLYALLGSFVTHSFAQQPTVAPDLPTLVLQIDPSKPLSETLLMEMSDRLAKAPLGELKTTLPKFIELTESPNARTRASALLCLMGLGGREKDVHLGSAAIDQSGLELLVPYLPRLMPRLTDEDPQNANLSVLLLNLMASIRPVPAGLVDDLIAALDAMDGAPSPVPHLADATNSMPSAGTAGTDGTGLVYILLNAGASYYLDPETHITEGRDSPEVQAAILHFLHRSRQTTKTLAETIHILGIAQPQIRSSTQICCVSSILGTRCYGWP